jgi:hypothetical protein
LQRLTDVDGVTCDVETEEEMTVSVILCSKDHLLWNLKHCQFGMTEPIRKIYAIKEMLDGPQGVEG